MSRLTRFVWMITALACTIAATTPFSNPVPLPVDFAPEGIAVGTGSTFYVGSLVDGDIYRGDLRSGDGSRFVNAPPGRQAAGLKVDEARHRLFVAGGATGAAFVYDTRDGSSVATRALGAPGASLINDVVVTRDAAYFTDSFNPVLYRVPLAAGGGIGPSEAIPLSGPAATIVPGAPNLNGIAAPRSGSRSGTTLVVGHTALGALFTVDPDTGVSRPVAVTGGALMPGTNDGLLLHGSTLWVVENFANRILELRMDPSLSSGRIVSVVTDADVAGLFRIPTTVAEHGDQLAVVNGRFDVGLPPPFGTGAPPGTEYDVVLVDKP
jgi:hypothetical protein